MLFFMVDVLTGCYTCHAVWTLGEDYEGFGAHFWLMKVWRFEERAGMEFRI